MRFFLLCIQFMRLFLMLQHYNSGAKIENRKFDFIIGNTKEIDCFTLFGYFSFTVYTFDRFNFIVLQFKMLSRGGFLFIVVVIVYIGFLRHKLFVKWIFCISFWKSQGIFFHRPYCLRTNICWNRIHWKEETAFSHYTIVLIMLNSCSDLAIVIIIFSIYSNTC